MIGALALSLCLTAGATEDWDPGPSSTVEASMSMNVLGDQALVILPLFSLEYEHVGAIGPLRSSFWDPWGLVVAAGLGPPPPKWLPIREMFAEAGVNYYPLRSNLFSFRMQRGPFVGLRAGFVATNYLDDFMRLMGRAGFEWAFRNGVTVSAAVGFDLRFGEASLTGFIVAVSAGWSF
jgi:hypothetical protein